MEAYPCTECDTGETTQVGGICFECAEQLKLFKRIPESKCLMCDYTLNAVTECGAKETHLPEEGDLTMCIRCYTPMCFNSDLSVRLMTQEEIEEFSDLVTEMISNIAFIKRNFGKAQGE